MEIPRDIIQRCHQRHKAVLRQRKTVVTPALYKNISYHFNVRCARETLLTLDALENAHISFMPIGRAPENDNGPRDYGGDRFLKLQRIEDWLHTQLFESWGIQIYTGTPSACNGAHWHDFYFTYKAICAAPKAVLTCLDALVMMTTTPLVTLTKSGGVRFSCRIPDYLHSNTDAEKYYIYKHLPTAENPHQRDVYLEIRGEKGYSRWDTRYEIVLGDLLTPPVIAKEMLFMNLNTLRVALHEPETFAERRIGTASEPTHVVPDSLGSDNLDLAKTAFLKRGFSYLREDIGFHHWILHDSEGNDTHASLWEDQGTVWIRTATPPTAPPTNAMPITDIWDDTSITPPKWNPQLPVTNKMKTVQKNKLSPLAVKRLPPILHRRESTQEVYATPKENIDEIQEALKKKTRILGIISEAAPGTDLITESYLRTESKIILDPCRSTSLEQIFESEDAAERICIIDQDNIDLIDMFIECVLSIDVLKKWTVRWRGHALGNYANAFLNVLTQQSDSDGNAIARIRAVTAAFQQYEQEIITQMCQVNVQGKVIACTPVVDTESGKELAHFMIVFEGNSTAYIPVDTAAEDKLKEKGLPCFRPLSFSPDEDIQISMSMEQAIALGVLDTETAQEIQEFTTVYPNPNWTLWHQLKRFFAHYQRDADAPIRWDDTILRFGMPPVLHPDIKRLLLISPTASNHYLQKVFLNDEIQIVHTKPTTWVPGNRVFQIRTGIYPQDEILNSESNWDVQGLSKLGERFFSGIRLEIDKDPTVKHGIITNTAIAKQVKDIASKENVCFVASFSDIDTVDTVLEEVQVLWIVGVPHWNQKTIWWLAQMLFGNDEVSLSYEDEIKLGHYKDERIRAVYHQCVVDSLTKVVGRTRLNICPDKTVILLTGLSLPNISDRSETLLFDWEDFQIAGGLHKLAETVHTREQLETERDALTGDSPREDVERIFGCSSRQANRILQKIRGGNAQRFSYRDQILFLLASGNEKKVSSLIAAIDSSPQAIGNELNKLVESGEIVRVRRGVYALSKK